MNKSSDKPATRPALPHHFDSPRQHFESNIFGMWLFLATEIMMFGGLFCAYAVYRSNHPEIFVYAHQFLDKRFGGINTIALITSSLTMAMALRCAQCNQRRGTIACLVLTFLFAGCFMGIKYVEYQQKWKHGLLWGQKYHPVTHAGHKTTGGSPVPSPASAASTYKTTAPSSATGTTALPATGNVVPPATTANPVPGQTALPPVPAGPQGLARNWREPQAAEVVPRNVQIFFAVYFAMTGLHGLHVFVGMGLILWLIVLAVKGRFNSEYFIPLDQVGLYWHLVDLIWIFLFPLLYLIH